MRWILILFSASIFAQVSNPVVILRSGSISGGGGSGAPITNLNVTATSPTQAIVTGNYAGSAAFGEELSAVSDFSISHPSVDSVLYPGSNLSTSNCIINSGVFSCVIGARKAPISSDGGRHSWALTESTTYYARFTAQGQSPVSFSFTTLTLPFGVGYVESQPTDPYHPGYNAFPDMPHSTRDFATSDPITGVMLKPLSLMTDAHNDIAGGQLNALAPSPWVGASNLQTTTNDGSTYATISGSTVPVFLSVANTGTPVNFVLSNMNGYGSPNSGLWGQFGAFQVTLQAAVNLSGSISGTIANNRLKGCITIDGVNCYSTPLTSAPLTTTIAPVVFGTYTTTNAVVDLWQSTDFAPTPAWFEQAYRGGTVTCSGVSVSLASGTPFGLHWSAGSNITINGAAYKIASVTNYASLTLQSSCSSGGTYFAANFGALIWKETNSPDTISFDSSTVSYRIDQIKDQYISGGPRSFNPTSVIGPGSEVGYLGAFGTAQLYWVGGTTGKATHVATTAGSNYGSGAPNAGFYDPLNANRYFGANADVFHVFTYYGNYANTPLAISAGSEANICTGSAPYTAAQPCVTNTTYSGIRAALTAFTASQAVPYTTSLFPGGDGALTMIGVDKSGSCILRLSLRGSTNVLSYLLVFDPYATTDGDGGTAGCVSGGTGCIKAATPSWTLPNARWANWKDGSSPDSGWSENFDYFGGSGDSGFYTTVVDGSADGSTNTISSSVASNIQCPANSYGAPTTVPPNGQCIKITVAGEPATSTTAAGVFGSVLPGDRFGFGTDSGAYNNEYSHAEVDMVLSKTASVSSGKFVYIVWRNINFQPPFHNFTDGALLSGAVGTYVSFIPGDTWNESDWRASHKYDWNWAANPHGTGTVLASTSGDTSTVPFDKYYTAAHLGTSGDGREITYAVPVSDNEVLAGHVTNGYAYEYSVHNQPSLTWAQKLNAGHNVFINSIQQFNSSTQTTGQDVGQYQTHAGAYRVPDATSAYSGFLYDGRPYRGGSASSCNAVNVTGTIWKFPVGCLGNIGIPYQKSAPTTAYAGYRPLVNVSGVGLLLDTSTNGNWTWCMVAVAGECYAGSAVGETYINAPYVSKPYCFNASQNLDIADYDIDLCISGSPSVKDANVQMDISAGSTSDGSKVRVLTKYTGARYNNVFYAPQGLTGNGKWTVQEAQFINRGSNGKQLVLVRVPPRPTSDGINRVAFEPMPVTIAARANSTAYVRFGYAENNSPRISDFLACTDRAEHCVATGTATTFSSTNPYQFETTESFTALDVSSSGATIQVPGIPTHVLYYQPVYKDKTSGVLTLGQLSVVAVP